MEMKPGQAILHYRLIEKVGSGGMGEVWSAQDTKLKRNVAIKILPPGLTADAERKLRFQREAETAAGLSHPNIAVIHEVGEYEGTPYLVMELLVGRTLREVVGMRAMPVSKWLEFALPIASALAYAHYVLARSGMGRPEDARYNAEARLIMEKQGDHLALGVV